MTPIAGLDVEIRITRSVALVPELRLRVYPLELLNDSCCGARFLTAKQALALRWRF